MDKFEPIDIEFLINSEEVKQDAARVRQEIEGVGLTAEDVLSKTSRKVKNEIQQSQRETGESLDQTKKKYQEMAESASQSLEGISPAVSSQLIRLVELERQLVEVQKAERQLTQAYESGAIEQDQYAKSAAGLRSQLLSTKEEMKSLTREMQDSGPVEQQQQQWNGLGNSINQITRELPAFTYSAQTGFMAVSNNIPILVDEINRLRVANAAAAASGAATIPVWHAIKAAIFSWGTAISIIITLFTVFGREIGDFIRSLFATKSALDDVKEAQLAMKEAFSSSTLSNAIDEITDLRSKLKLAKDGLLDQNSVVELYNETVGRSTKEVNSLKEAEEGLAQFADQYIKASMLKAAADAAREKGVKDQIALIEKQLEAEEKVAAANEKFAKAQANPNKIGRGQFASDARSTAAINLEKAQKELDKVNKELDKTEAKTQRVVDKLMQKSLGTGVNVVGEESDFNRITAGIKKVTEAYATAGMEREEREIQQIRSKFQKLREEANRFNSDPANKANIIDLSGLDEAESRALAAVRAKKSGTRTDQVTKEHEQLLAKVEALDIEYARKSFEKDEEEIQALRDKFAKVRELVERFNADPKNQAKRIDLTGLNATEEKAVGDLSFRQDTEKLKKSLEEQKHIYQEFDRVVADFGIQEAERRFQGQLEVGRKYVDLLREEHDKLAAMPSDQLNGPQRERLLFLEQQLRKEEEVQRKQLDSLLKTLQGYDAERELMIEQHLLRVEELRKGGFETEVANETQRHQDEINALDIAQIKKLEIFQDFFQRVDTMSTKNAKKLIEDIRKAIVGLREQYPNLVKFFDDLEVQLIKTESKISDRLPRDVMQLAQGFRQMAQEVSGVNAGLGKMLGMLSDNLARVSEIKRGMSDFSAARQTGDGFGAVVAGAGVAGAVVGGIIQLNSLMIQANQRQADILKKQLDFQRQLFFGELEINRLVRERSLEQSKIDGNTLASLIAQREALKENYQQISEDIEGIESIFGRNINRLDLEQLSLYDIRTKQFKSEFEKKMAELGQSLFVEGTKTVRGGFLGLGKKEVEVFGSLAGKTFEEIEKLFAKGQLTAEAEKLFIQLRDLKNEGKEVEKALRDIENQMKSILTGGATAGQMADSIIQGFREGRRAVEDFAEDVEELLRKAILSGFKYRFLEAPLNELLDQLYKDAQSDDGLSPEEIERFTQAYNNITQSALDALKELEAATGTSLSNPLSTGNRQGIQGGITRLTEETGQELAGLFRGFFDITKRSFQLSEQRFVLEQRHYETSIQMLLTQGRIEANTAMTVEKLETAVVELKMIAKNTKGGQSSWDLGLGGG